MPFGAIKFARDWSDASRERGESQTFWNEFFDVFGLKRRVVASFEDPVKSRKGDTQFIDLFWKGKLIAEHKSRGKDLDKAHTQAMGYIQDLVNSGRADDAPQYILVSDFARFALHDLEAPTPETETLDFDLRDLPKHIRTFGFIAGYESRRLNPEDPANLDAVRRLANLHDRLEEAGYAGHDLQRFMVRILFCLFAEDSGILEPDVFTNFIQNETRPDGADLGPQLARLFGILNTPEDQRQKSLDENLAALPYVNGQLYAEHLAFPEFDSPMRTALLDCCHFHWEKISPAIFGSLFQGVMDAKERRQIGAHYTSERDILKLVHSLFLDDLRAESHACRGNQKKLADFHRKLGNLKLLDPACGCGNFLVVGYRELRRLEMDVLAARFGDSLSEGDIRAECRVNVSQMFGIEIEEWPVRIAEVALWLMDHQMNCELFARFGQPRATTPLAKSPTIRQANALRIDWNDVLPAAECSYVLGNPPFVGAKFQTDEQRGDMQAVTGDVDNAGLLDFVCGWYFKAADYTRGTSASCAFVSTNSITQGEQVGTLWPALFRRGVKIHFGHRTFVWASEAKGKAHVHVVIVGFGHSNPPNKRIYDYELDESQPAITTARNISPYLIEGSDNAVTNRSKPLCDVPEIRFGNQPIDGGHLILSEDAKAEMLAKEPNTKPYIRPYVGSDEFLNGGDRYCLWLEGISPSALKHMPAVLSRVEEVREFRLSSKREATRDLATTPTQFAFVSHPQTNYLLIPSVSSERRPYIPIGFKTPQTIASNLCLIIPNATPYHFGILSSTMHMAWVRQVCGRLKSDYRYSNKLVYNNYPWPQQATDKQKSRVEECAQAVLDARLKFPGATLADLYDPLTMPPALANAHQQLDTAVDRCYRSQPFTSERQRVEYLFALYETLTAPLTAPAKKPRKRGPTM